MHNVMYVEDLFQDAKPGSTYSLIWEMLKPSMSIFPTNSENAYLTVNSSETKYALMLDHTQLEYTQLQNCDLYTIADELFNVAGTAFPMPSGAPFINDVSYK